MGRLKTQAQEQSKLPILHFLQKGYFGQVHDMKHNISDIDELLKRLAEENNIKEENEETMSTNSSNEKDVECGCLKGRRRSVDYHPFLTRGTVRALKSCKKDDNTRPMSMSTAHDTRIIEMK